MKIQFILGLVVLLAGCIGGGDGLPQAGDGGTKQPSDRPAGSGELSVNLSGLPKEVSGTEYFTIVAEATEDVEDVKIFLYNLGSYLQSSCSGVSSLRDISSGEKKEASCSLRATEKPLENTTQEIMYEASYKISKYVGQVAVRVYDAEEYDRVNPSEGEDSADLNVGELRISPENVKEGESIAVMLELDDDLAIGDNCGCNIEKVLLKVPRGFSISGDSGWTRSTCGNFNCYERRNVKVPFTADLILSIVGVTKTETFYVGVEVDGVWKVTRGSDTVLIHS